MVNIEACKKQYKRLLHLPFAPKETMDGEKNPDFRDMRKEYERVMCKACKSDEHLALVIDHIMNSAGRFPAPSAIMEAAGEVQAPEHRAPVISKESCTFCHGSGYVSFERLVNVPGLDSYMASFADYCSCTFGQWLKAAQQDKIKRA